MAACPLGDASITCRVTDASMISQMKDERSGIGKDVDANNWSALKYLPQVNELKRFRGPV